MKSLVVLSLLFSSLHLAAAETLKLEIPIQEWDKKLKSGVQFENPVPAGMEIESMVLETVFFWPYHDPQELEGIWILNQKQLGREALSGERGEWVHRLKVDQPEFDQSNKLLFLNPKEAWIYLEKVRIHIALKPAAHPIGESVAKM